ncbi:hypothetical protein ILYODFUR_000981 [Ilyodon furcidens]|uniref:Uncharacterized protein n=1 Tax=Ilyodon furcidens TaxID=33524 RepID=A0ABV0URW8_9TELE
MERKGLQQTLCFLTYHFLVIPNADELVELPQISLFSVFPNTKTYVEVLLNMNSIHTHPGNSSSSAMRHTSIQLHVSILRVSVVETACSDWRLQSFLTPSAVCLNLHKSFFMRLLWVRTH